MKNHGLYVKDGRLINDRPDGESGIAMAARLRAEMKGSKKVRNIADGIELAEERKAMQSMFKKLM
tara:strand:- start:258 stop:452 length:195 start_codon:yes stop_codon:yes gene_type:complete